jgi:glycosyltransferase involved in cell wall biosynthesis
MKTLLVLAPEHQREQPEDQRRLEVADESPRVSLLEETLGADVIDGLALQNLRSRSRLARWLGKILPLVVLQALVVYRWRRRYDVVVSWDDRFALVYAFLLRLTRSQARHVAILSWMAPPKKAFALKFAQKRIDRIVLWSQTQRDLLVEFFGISASRIVVIPYFVDQNFWRPLPGAVQGICSAGDSRRDYATLIAAIKDLDLPCTIATHVQLTNLSNSDWDETSRSLKQVPTLPSNVLVKAASLPELRSIYARARFIVLPLFPSFRDSGITIVTQAMAMGKAIICSRIQGQLEFLEEGVTGLFVPPGDPDALREAIHYLLEHPEVAERMGEEGRRRAEAIFALDHFAANVSQVAEDVVAGTPTVLIPYRYQAGKRYALSEKSGAI